MYDQLKVLAVKGAGHPAVDRLLAQLDLIFAGLKWHKCDTSFHTMNRVVVVDM